MKHWAIGIVLVIVALIAWAAINEKRQNDHGMERVDRSINCIWEPEHYYCDDEDFGVPR